jgi:hypothetical protein
LVLRKEIVLYVFVRLHPNPYNEIAMIPDAPVF